MGVATETSVSGEQLGEPVGAIRVEPAAELRGTTVEGPELPAIIDEVPVLAMLAACARGESRFLGASELRGKESDRLGRVARGIRGLGGHAAVAADDLVIAGGGLRGGMISSGGDHRLAMAFAIAGVGADGPIEVDGMEAADVSFPGFADALRSAGVGVEVVA